MQLQLETYTINAFASQFLRNPEKINGRNWMSLDIQYRAYGFAVYLISDRGFPGFEGVQRSHAGEYTLRLGGWDDGEDDIKEYYKLTPQELAY